MTSTDNRSYDLLHDNLSEAQATIRSYDSKAQIVGIGYIFALGIVGKWAEMMGTGSTDINFVWILVAWGIVMMPILLFGFVLYPSRLTVTKSEEDKAEVSENILYLENDESWNVARLKAAAIRADPLTELSFELLKISKLRIVKRKRFLRGLFAAGLSFSVIFASQLARSL